MSARSGLMVLGVAALAALSIAFACSERELGRGLGRLPAEPGRYQDLQRHRAHDRARHASGLVGPHPPGQHVRHRAARDRARDHRAARARSSGRRGSRQAGQLQGPGLGDHPRRRQRRKRRHRASRRRPAGSGGQPVRHRRRHSAEPAQQRAGHLLSHRQRRRRSDRLRRRQTLHRPRPPRCSGSSRSTFSRPRPRSAIVAFGDSITDGTCSTLDSNDRWEDIVAQRFALQTPVRFAVVNEGIGGNTVTRAGSNPTFASPPGVERLDRDVLSRAGVSHVVLFMGTNDINRDASAAEVIAGSKDIIARIKAKNIKVIGATIIPAPQRHRGTRPRTRPGARSTIGSARTRASTRCSISMRSCAIRRNPI